MDRSRIKLGLGALCAMWVFILAIIAVNVYASGRRAPDKPGATAVTVIAQAGDASGPAPEIVVTPEQLPDAPTAISRALVDAIDTAGGKAVDRGAAIIILGIVLIAFYRVLQHLIGKAKTPVGTFWLNTLARIVAILFGSDAAWKNRVIARGTPFPAEQLAKQAVMAKVRSDNPIIKPVLDKAVFR